MTEPKKRKIVWELSIGFPGAVRKGAFEIEDEYEDDEILEMAEDAAMQHIEVSWKNDDD